MKKVTSPDFVFRSRTRGHVIAQTFDFLKQNKNDSLIFGVKSLAYLCICYDWEPGASQAKPPHTTFPRIMKTKPKGNVHKENT